MGSIYMQAQPMSWTYCSLCPRCTHEICDLNLSTLSKVAREAIE